MAIQSYFWSKASSKHFGALHCTKNENIQL